MTRTPAYPYVREQGAIYTTPSLAKGSKWSQYGVSATAYACLSKPHLPHFSTAIADQHHQVTVLS